MNTLKLDDFLKYKFLSAIEYSPEGGKAAFVVANADADNNCYERRLWLYKDGALKQLTDLGKEGSFIWESENSLLFPAVRSSAEKKRAESKDAFTSYYRLSLEGGEALHAFTLPFSCSKLKYYRDNIWIAVGDVDMKCPDYATADEDTRKKYAADADADKDYEVFDETPFWMNGAGITNGHREGLFLCRIIGEEVSVCRIAPACFDTFDILIDGDNAYITGTERGSIMIDKAFSLYTLEPEESAETGFGYALKKLSEYELEVGGLCLIGGKLCVSATAAERFGLNENAWIYSVDTASGELSVLRREEYSMYGSVGSDCRLGGGKQAVSKGGCLYHIVTRGGFSLLYRIEPDGSSVPVITKGGSLDCFSVCEQSGKALLIAMYDNRLQELYEAELDSGEVRKISSFNDDVLKDVYVAGYEKLNIVSEGLDIEGWVMLPKDYDPSKEKACPAVLDIHGGPKTVYGPVFYHEMQLWANMGYFVFFCNPKGSDGRGNEFADIRGEYGGTDYINLMDFTDAVLAKYTQIDPTRVCETGGSYGGFMTNWIIGHTDRFCCAASQRSIANWVSFYGISDIGPVFASDQNAADPFGNAEKLWQHSPMKYAANAKTPTLFIHSDEDYRCPMAEGLQMHTSLLMHGVPTRLCLFHGENHDLSRSGKPLHRVRRLKEITDWFEKYSR